MIHQALKLLRSNSTINKIGRSVIHRLLINSPITLAKKITPKWRTYGKYKLSAFGKEFFYYNESDDQIFEKFYLDNATRKKGSALFEYDELEELKFFCHQIKEAKCAIDIGANTGLYSVVGAAHNPNAQIFAFEPMPANIIRLQKNLKINAHQNVSVIKKAIGNTNGTIKFAAPKGNKISDVASADIDFSNSFYKDSITFEEIEVPITTLDTFIEEHSLQNVDLIKVDIENYEIPFFEGALKTLSNNKPIVMFEMFWDTEKRKFFKESILPIGYDLCIITNRGTLKIDLNDVQKVEGRNFLLIPV